MSEPFINDGSIPYGSRILELTNPGGAAVEYVAERLDIRRPSTKVELRGIKNQPTGKVCVSDFDTGTATLQLATDATVIPKRGAVFTETFDGTEETFYVTEIGQAEEQGGIKKVNISFDKKYNVA